MSIFESKLVNDTDATLVLQSVARYIMKHNNRKYCSNMRLLLPFWDHRLVEKGVLITSKRLALSASFGEVVEFVSQMEWDRDPEWDRDFFEGFLDACAYVERNPTYLRAQLIGKKRFMDFLESQDIAFMYQQKKRLIYTKPLYFLEIKPPGNLEKYLRGVISGALAFRRDDGLWVSVRAATRPVLDRLGIVYEEGKKKNLLISPFYAKLFNDDLPEPMATYWREQLGTKNHLNATIVAWMHWEVMFGRKRRRTLDAFPYLKSPQGSNRLGLCFEQIREKMKRHRFDHVDSRIADRLKKWMESQKEETNE